MPAINQRITELITSFGLNTSSFGKVIGGKYQTLYNVVGPRQTAPSAGLLSDILKAYPQVRSEWLLNGEGDMFHHRLTDATLIAAAMINDKGTVKPVGPAITVNEPNPADFNPDGPDHDPEDAIHFVPIPAEASYLQGFGDQEYIEHLPKLYLPFLGLGAGVYAFVVSGDSMSDRFNNGDVFFGQLVNKDDALRWGEVYALLCNDGLVIKELRRGPDNDHFTLRSFNEHFDPYEVQKTEVRALYRYRAALNFNSSNPNRTSVLKFLTLLSEQVTDLTNTISKDPLIKTKK